MEKESGVWYTNIWRSAQELKAINLAQYTGEGD